MKPYLALVAIAACAQTPGAGPASSKPDDPLVPGTTSVLVTEQGGLAPAPAAGSTCTPANDMFTLDLDARTLASRTCSAPANTLVFSFVTAQKSLTDAEFTALSDALQAIRPPADPCGSDFHATVTFTTPTSTTTHADAECWTGWSNVDDALYSIEL
jgi:hypothetical protein